MQPSQVKSLLETAIKHPNTTPPMFLEGPPGIGKSAIPREVAAEAGIGYLDLRLAQRDPTDLRGIPAVIDGKARWLSPPELPTEGRGILMLDEITSCPPLTQASAYQLTLDRKISEYTLPDGWYIIAAGNRMKDRAVVFRMSTALANRFIHINFEANLPDWNKWAYKNQINPNIIGFLGFRADLLAPEFNPDADEKAFPTPRTWEFVSKLLATVSDTAILHEAIQGTIGSAALSEFSAFLKVQTQLPDLNKIFAGDNWVPADGRMDLYYALTSALAMRAQPKQMERMLQYSEHLPAEFAVMLCSILIGRHESDFITAPSFAKWARTHSDIITVRKKAK